MLRRTLLIGIAGVTLASCAQRMTRQEQALEEQMVRDRATAWVRAFSNRDVDSLATFYLQDPDLTVAWPDGRRLNGWDAESQAQRGYFDGMTTMNLVAQDLQVRVLAPDAALVTFRHSTDEIRGTNRDLFSGQGTLLWTKLDAAGSWVILAQQLSRTPAAPPEAPPTRRR
jgi:ketosteroid isomerase-like protein